MLRVGIIGSGFMGGIHTAAWRETPATLAGYYSLDEARAAKLAQQYGGQLYGSLDELIRDVDVVDICSPTYLHDEMILAAAAAGKMIICEKPLALTYNRALNVVEACEAAGVPLLVAHVVRFFPEYARTKQIIDQGDIGKVAVVRLTRGGFQPRSSYENWFLDPTKSGGMMFDLMIHDYDYARWIAGEVSSVYARGVRARNPDAAEDYAIAILKHENGAISNVEGVWAYPHPMFRTALEVAGSDGLIEHPAESSQPLAFYMKQSPAGETPDVGLPRSPVHESPYTTEVRHFYDVLVNGAAPRVTARDGLAAVRIALAGIRSAQTGREVKIEEII